MDPMINMTLILEKELELECQGMRRTRRYIGDASQVTDDRWYQRNVPKVVETRHDLNEEDRTAETHPPREGLGSILSRLLHLPSSRQSACGKVYNEFYGS